MSAAAFSLGTLFVEIEARTAEAAAVLQKFGDDASKMIDQQKEKWDGLAQTGQSFMQVGGALTAGITLPLAGMAAASLDAAGKFEASMNKVSALGDITGADFKTLEDAAIKWGADTQFSAQQAADAMAELAAKGQTTTQIMDTMPGVLALAAAGQTSLADASKITTNTIAQFGMQASDSGKVADVLAQGAAQSAAGVKELGSSLNYVAPVAKSAGLTLEQTVGTLAVLSNNGIEATKAGTSLRGMIASLESPSKAAADAMQSLGVTATDSSGKLLPLNDVMLQFKNSGASTADMFKIFGREGATAATILKDNAGPALENMTKSMENSAGAAQRMADQLNKGIGFGLEQMKGSIETAGIALGQTLAPAFNAVVAGITAVVNKVTEFVQWFSGLPDPVKNAAIALGAMAAAIGPLILGLGGIMTAIGTLMPALTSLAGFFGTTPALLGPWGLAIAAVTAALVALGTWIYQNWAPIVAVVKQGVENIKGSFLAWMDLLAGPFIKIWSGVLDMLSKIPGIGATFAGVKAQLDAFGKSLSDSAEQAKKNYDASKSLGQIWEDAGKKVDAAKKKQDDHTAAVKDAGKQAGTTAKAAADMGVAIEKTGKTAGATADKFKPLIEKNELLYAQYKDLQSAHDKILKQLVALQPALKQTADEYAAAQDPTETLTKLTDLQTAAWENAATITVPKILTKLGDYKTAVDAGAEAAKQLGLKAAETNTVTVEAAEAAYQAVLNNPLASEYDKQAAAVKALKLEIDAVWNTGETYAGQLQDLQGKLQTAKEAMGDFSGAIKETNTNATELKNNTFASDLQRNIGGAVDEIIGKLTHGDLSFGETMKTLFKNIGEDAMHLFIDPLKTGVENFIKTTIADLLGGKGFGGVLDSLEAIGTSIGKLFGKGAGAAADVAGGAAQAGAGAAQAGGSGASAAGGILSQGVQSLVGMVSGVISAVTGVIGVFQAAHQETSLNAIEHNTRFGMMYLGERADGGILGVLFRVQENTQYLPAQLDGINAKLIQWLEPLKNGMADLLGKADAAQTRFDEVSNNTYWSLQAQQDNTRLLTEIRDALLGQKPAVNIYVSGAQSPAATADAIGAALRAQGAFA